MSGPKTTDTVNQIRYLAAVLEREVSVRNASGAELRIRAAGFLARKMVEDFDWETQPTIRQ